ncbi:MAG: fused MFS/spermidine synthase [Pseudomonadota bacterium]
MRLLFAFALLLSATLTLWIQPMVGKMLLPVLGGAPAVWNSCLVFFQSALLLGYLYAHGQARLAGLRLQIALHLCLVLAAAAFLPVHIYAGMPAPTETSPIPWLLVILTVSVGLPFVLLSATAPLLQSWFTHTGDPSAKDPYFLYAASNAGSLLGLLGYPILAEPHLTLSDQAWAWGAGYATLVLLLCAVARPLLKVTETNVPFLETAAPLEEKNRPITWLVLAAVPSALLQSVTSYVTMDIAAVPLLWVIPLAIYLMSFVLVFSPRQVIPQGVVRSIHPLIVLSLVILSYWQFERGLALMLPINCLVLFTTSMVCHGELVRLRPRAGDLTAFYLWMSFGGMIGGIFNAIIAPMVFRHLTEYPISLALAALVVSDSCSPDRAIRYRLNDFVYASAFGLGLGALVWGLQEWLGGVLMPQYRTDIAVAAALAAYRFSGGSLRLGWATVALLAVGLATGGTWDQTLFSGRNFFGVTKVTRHPAMVVLVSGTADHGKQLLHPKGRLEPTSYYSREGPLGDVFGCIAPRSTGRSIGSAGLGAGTIACYAVKEDHLVFYEIDPLVRFLARDSGFFTFLKDCPAKTDIVMGDARLSLAQARDGSFDLLVLDVFTSDSIPVHLLTKEAVMMYVNKLAPSGLLAVHFTNRHLDLKPVLAGLASDAKLEALTCDHRTDKFWSDNSRWAVMARNSGDLACLAATPRWVRLSEGSSSRAVWTDDYSNLWPHLKLRGD